MKRKAQSRATSGFVATISTDEPQPFRKQRRSKREFGWVIKGSGNLQRVEIGLKRDHAIRGWNEKER
jgi:hypothetical protein